MHRPALVLQNMAQRLAQMRTGTKQARVIMHDQIYRNILYVGFKTPLIFKTTTETRSFKEVEEARYDAASDVHTAKRAQR